MSRWNLGRRFSNNTRRRLSHWRLNRKILPIKVGGSFISRSLESFDKNITSNLNSRGKKIKRHHLDSTYWTCTKSEFKQIVAFNDIDQRKYIGQRFDCDNFAISFKGQVATDFGLNNVGLVIDNSGGHAYNIVVFSNGEVELFEPQNDSFPEKGSHQSYAFKEGIILL